PCFTALFSIATPGNVLIIVPGDMKVGGPTGFRLFGHITLLALGFIASAHAGPKLDTKDPLGFFTNLASRLLQSELNLDLTRIQIYPTNQYTPAVHRL